MNNEPSILSEKELLLGSEDQSASHLLDTLKYPVNHSSIAIDVSVPQQHPQEDRKCQNSGRIVKQAEHLIELVGSSNNGLMLSFERNLKDMFDQVVKSLVTKMSSVVVQIQKSARSLHQMAQKIEQKEIEQAKCVRIIDQKLLLGIEKELKRNEKIIKLLKEDKWKNEGKAINQVLKKRISEQFQQEGSMSTNRVKPMSELERRLFLSEMDKLEIVGESLRKNRLYEEAEYIYRKVFLEIKERLGPDHLQTLRGLCLYGIVIYQKKNFRRAKEIFNDAMKAGILTNQAKHPFVLQAKHNYAECLLEMQKYSEAEEWFRVALKERKEIEGAADLSTITSMIKLAIAIYKQERYDQAEELYRQIMKICEEDPHKFRERLAEARRYISLIESRTKEEEKSKQDKPTKKDKKCIIF